MTQHTTFFPSGYSTSFFTFLSNPCTIFLYKVGKRPRLTDELEALRSSHEPEVAQSGVEREEKEGELDALEFLVDLFCRCTEENPTDRPTAEELYEMLLSRTSNLTGKK